MRVAFLKNKNRNDSLSIGASVIIDELLTGGVVVEICNYETAFDYDIVMISMTSTEDIFDLYGNMFRAGWERRTFTAIVGGFGCQNPWALSPYVDYAFFGRADGVMNELLNNLYGKRDVCGIYSCVAQLRSPRKVDVRQVGELYPRSVRYGKNMSVWTEKFVGCPNRCAFCHYSWNRKRIGGKAYINDGLSSGSPELMLNDICSRPDKFGRFTTALDGYSERLRYLFGKHISWQQVEEALDHVASFRGNTYIKLYNIHNFPTETEADRQEFFDFFSGYAENSMKPDGVVMVEVLNTAFRPSINTPMQRMEARLFPPARYEDNRVAAGDGFVFKMSVNNRDAYSHLQDLISIRYTERHYDLIHYIATDRSFAKMNNAEKLMAVSNRTRIEDFIRSYSLDEYLPADLLLSDGVKKAEEKLLKKFSLFFYISSRNIP
jgi:radical SAM superfamily enzyme YgiQ (UPF0313 family)